MRLDIFLRRLSVYALSAAATFILWTPVAAWSAPRDPNSGAGTGTTTTQTTRGTLPTVRTTPSQFNGSIADSNGDRLSDRLGMRLSGMEPDARLDVIVTFTGPNAHATGRIAAGEIQINHEFNRINAFAATMTAAQARAMAAAAGVVRVEEDATLSASLLAARADYGVERIRSETALDTGAAISGANVGICIVDTGADPLHEQLFDETAGKTRIVAFKDFIGDADGVIQTAPYDDQGHGTNVSNIAAGDGTGPSSFAAPLRGVAPAADIFAAKALNHFGNGATSRIILAVEWCASQPGVRVINLSLGSSTSSDGQDALSLVINDVVRSGITVVVAAGNAGAVPGTIGSPAAASGAITVGASSDYTPTPYDPSYVGGPYTAAFSGRGPTVDGRAKPDILAPGISITGAFVENALVGISPCPAPCYVIITGTSMAAPFVAGTVALMHEAADAAGPSLTPDAAREILYRTAQDRFPGLGKDHESGFGLIDAYAAVNAARGRNDVAPTPFPATMGARSSVPNDSEIWIDIDTLEPDKPLAVTLTLDGEVGRFGWKPDMDAELYLVNGDGSLGLVGESTCAAGTECGRQGRQETLKAPAPLAGTYRLRVFGYDGRPNFGLGGTFAMEISNGRTRAGDPSVSEQADTPTQALAAHATGDLTVIADPATGTATVSLDGSGSVGKIAAYSWTATSASIPDGMFSSVTLAAGAHTVTLTVDDGQGGANAVSIDIAVCEVECVDSSSGPPRKGKKSALLDIR